MDENQTIPGRERFSFWLDFEDRRKLETIAESEDLKLGYLIRKAVKNYVQENYAKAMVEVVAKDYQEKLKKKNRTKTKPLTKSQQKTLRVGVNERKRIGQQKEQRRREEYNK